MKKKKSKKFIIGLILAIVGVLGFFSLATNPENKVEVVIFSLIILAVGAFLIFIDKKKTLKAVKADKKDEKPVTSPEKVSTTYTEKKKIPDGEMNYNLFQDVVDNSALTYQYEESLCVIDGAFEHIPGNGGKTLIFKQEPENPHDNKAVAIYLNDTKIGYIYRGTIQDMFNDYTKRGWLVSGYLNKYSVADNKATYKIGFYKPFESFVSKQFSLVKTKKKIDEYSNREDNLFCCSDGDLLFIDEEDDCYIVYNESYAEIGELPKSASNFINNNEYKKIIGIFIESNEEDEYADEKEKAQITVYLVK